MNTENELQPEAPEDVAARTYGALLPQLDSQIYSLSKGGLLRVLIATVKTPLEDYNFKLSKKENNVAVLLQKLLDCKFIMITSVLGAHFEELKLQDEEKERNKKLENLNTGLYEEELPLMPPVKE